MDKIYANMATIPNRIPQLETVVNCILPQVDQLNIYLNNFEEVPWFLKDNNKINIVRSQDEGDRGDAGKFFWSDKVNGYYFTIDDDIAYPPDYVEVMKKGLDKRGKKCAVGMHGEMYGNEIRHWTKDRKGTQHFYYELANDTPTCVLGTGCALYHTDFIDVKPEYFESPNMADVWFTLICDRQRKFRVVLAHQRGWLQILHVPEQNTLWGKTRQFEEANPDRVSKEVEVIQECLPWKGIQDIPIWDEF
jgi:hypothetical protein